MLVGEIVCCVCALDNGELKGISIELSSSNISYSALSPVYLFHLKSSEYFSSPSLIA